jgi:hypothetical protein
MDKHDLLFGLAWLALGVWTLADDAPVLLGIGLVVLGFLYLVTAVFPNAGSFWSLSNLPRR